jgi:enterochelin esterase-like enzyme
MQKREPTSRQVPIKLEIDAAPIERVLAGSQPDEYVADFTAGEFYSVTALQEGVELVIEVYAPDGEQIASVDTWHDDPSVGPEEWNETATITGQYRFVIRKDDGTVPDGKYTMVVRNSQWYAAKWIKDNIKSPRMAKLWQDSASNPKAVEEFLAEREGKGPLIEPKVKDEKSNLVTFFIKAPSGTSRVKLEGGPVLEWQVAMEGFGDTGLWFVTLDALKDSRFSYRFTVLTRSCIGGVWISKETYIKDASNPLGEVLVLEDAPKQPFDAPLAPDTACGEVKAFEMHSAHLGEKRTYSVYTPPHFDANKLGHYGVLFVFDGESYGTWETPPIDMPKIMNNAIAAGKVPPMIVVLVNSLNNRSRILTCYEPFADFMAKELLPEIRRQYPAASPDPNRNIVAGSSFGGIASTYCAMMHPEAFGNVLSQSGSYMISGADWTNEDFTTGIPPEAFFQNQFAEKEKLPIRFYIEVGTYESTAGFLRPNRHLRDILKLKGYDVTYSEFNGNHDHNAWRGTITEGIACLTRDWK